MADILKSYGQISELRDKIYFYIDAELPDTKRYLAKLEKLLSPFPKRSKSILIQDGFTLLSFLKKDYKDCRSHLRMVISRIEKLQESVGESVENKQYTAKLGKTIIGPYNKTCLKHRKQFLKKIEEK